MSRVTRAELYEMLNGAIERAGGQARFAAAHGVTRQHVNRVVNATSAPGPAILAALGLRQVTHFVRTNGGENNHGQ